MDRIFARSYRHKQSLFTTMLDLAYHLSSSWPYFLEKCECLKSLFCQLKSCWPAAIAGLGKIVSQKIGQDLQECETKPHLVNQQCIVYQFKCNLCDTGSYVGYTPGIYVPTWVAIKARHLQYASTMTTTTQVLSLRTSSAVSKFSRNAGTNSIVLSTRCFTSNN